MIECPFVHGLEQLCNEVRYSLELGLARTIMFNRVPQMAENAPCCVEGVYGMFTESGFDKVQHDVTCADRSNGARYIR
jgi:hypothetical protein